MRTRPLHDLHTTLSTRSVFVGGGLSALFCVLAACVGSPPDDVTGSGGDTGGGGDGTGGGTGTGEGTGGGGTGGTGGMTATQFLTQIGQRFCDQAFTCRTSFPSDAGVTFDQAFGATAQQCYTDSLESYQTTQVEAQITAGKIRWNAADAATCLAGITFGTCTQFWNDGPTMPSACTTALVGTIADGQACVTHIECSNLESYCDDTSRTCTPDTAGVRAPEPADHPLHTQPLVLRR